MKTKKVLVRIVVDMIPNTYDEIEVIRREVLTAPN